MSCKVRASRNDAPAVDHYRPCQSRIKSVSRSILARVQRFIDPDIQHRPRRYGHSCKSRRCCPARSWLHRGGCWLPARLHRRGLNRSGLSFKRPVWHPGWGGLRRSTLGIRRLPGRSLLLRHVHGLRLLLDRRRLVRLRYLRFHGLPAAARGHEKTQSEWQNQIYGASFHKLRSGNRRAIFSMWPR